MKSDKEEGEPSPFFFRLAVSRAFLLLTERLEKANNQHVGWVFVGFIVFFSTRSLFVVANNCLNHSIKKVSSTACVRIYTVWFICCTIQGDRWKTTYILMTLPPHSQCLIIPELVISSSPAAVLAFSKAVTLSSCTTCTWHALHLRHRHCWKRVENHRNLLISFLTWKGNGKWSQHLEKNLEFCPIFGNLVSTAYISWTRSLT